MPAAFTADDDVLVESTGLWFEQFAIGQRFAHRPGITVSQEENVADALASLNQAMIHYDTHYAAATEFGQPLVVSTLTLQRAIGLAWKTYGRRRRILGFSHIRLTAPVFAGDTLYAASEILAVTDTPDTPDCGRIEVALRLDKPDGTTIADIACALLMPRRKTAR
jgi:itaconyl-CoA hydratase